MSEPRAALADLLLLVGFVFGATAALLLPGVPWQLEWAVGIPLVLIVPGYAVVSALLPASQSVSRGDTGKPDPPGRAARAAMTLIASAILVAVVGVLLSSVGLLRLGPVVLGLGAVSIAGAAIAGVRRQRVPATRRVDPLAAASPRSIPDRLGISGIQAVVLLFATLALVGALVVAGSNPPTESSFSEASLLAGDGTDKLLGSDGPVTLVDGKENTIHLRITNHEGESISYGVVGRLQRVDENGAVLDTQRIGDESITVEDGTGGEIRQQIDPSVTTDTLRLQYLVYTGPIPDDPRPGNADLSVRHQIEVVEEEST